ncbi:MAG: ATP-binding protein [Rhodomicrobium sp.]
MDPQLVALREINFDFAQHLENIWKDIPYHIDEFNGSVSDELIDDLTNGTREIACPSPLGWVIAGQAGTGKTHLLGALRHKTWAVGGWFILFDLLDVKDFWSIAALSYLHSLHREMPDGRLQSEALIARLAHGLADEALQAECTTLSELTPDKLATLADRLIAGLPRKYANEARSHKQVLRALLLLHAKDNLVADNAYNWLQGIDTDEEFGRTFGFNLAQPTPRDIVQGLSWLMSLTGPTLLAIDQIDAIISEQNLASGPVGDVAGTQQQKALSILEGLGRGLMDLRDITRRTMTVVSCIEASWHVLSARTIQSVIGRFNTDPIVLAPINNATIAQALVAKRLSSAFERAGFAPPYSSWPFRPEAFRGAAGMYPRELLKICDAHRRACLRAKQVTELTSFSNGAGDGANVPEVAADNGADIDRRFAELKERVNVKAFLEQDAESREFCDVLQAAMRCYALQCGPGVGHVELAVDDNFTGDRPPLHARLRFIDRSANDREHHVCFRALTSRNAIAFQTRLKAAITLSGIDQELSFRRLFILRRPALPSGRKTSEIIGDFKAAGGVFVDIKEHDLRSFSALQLLERERPAGFEDWLRTRAPLKGTHLFDVAGLSSDGNSWEGIFGAAAKTEHPSTDHATTAEISPQNSPASTGAQPMDKVFIGHRLDDGATNEAIYLNLFDLNRHTALLAGSGSGKTVALRRLVEEAALQGVPAIVLDTNNDLARLGQPWPQRPESWSDDDANAAQLYHKNVEVVIWTPLLSRGNPLNLAPMPDFSTIRDDPDELRRAVLLVSSTLKPHAIPGGGESAVLREGILTCALEYFARNGTGSLDDLISLLSELPEDAGGGINDAPKLAQKMADQLRAAMARNPLLATGGQTLDPAVLLTGAAGKTRISVINFSGLPSDEQKQAFVNQLAMILFTWIKKRPASAERPIQGLLVIDEAQNFVPSGRGVPSKASLIGLTQQGRKYGLGLIFATQAPRGIDHQIILNCTTQFIGKANAPAAIETAQELIRERGGRADDIARLDRGQFYVYSAGFSEPAKILTPLCLSYHPATPLSEDEVVCLAQMTRGA